MWSDMTDFNLLNRDCEISLTSSSLASPFSLLLMFELIPMLYILYILTLYSEHVDVLRPYPKGRVVGLCKLLTVNAINF
jgi:hypothetical protein